MIEARSLLSRIAISPLSMFISQNVPVWGSLECGFFAKYFCLPTVTKKKTVRKSAIFFYFAVGFPTDIFANTVIKSKLHSSIATEVIMGYV